MRQTCPDAESSAKVALLVEDEQIVHRYVRYVLLEMGFTVLDADSGEEALEIVRQHAGSIDLLLTDLRMPGIDGIDLANQVRQIRPEVKVLIISGHPSANEQLCDGAEFLEKPFLPDALKAKVNTALSRRSSSVWKAG